MATTHITDQLLYACDFTELSQSSKHTKNHAEHSNATMIGHEQDVINPFTLDNVPDELVNITIGQLASYEVLNKFVEVAQRRNST